VKTKDKPTPADSKTNYGLLFRFDPKFAWTRRTAINRQGHDTNGGCDLAFSGWRRDLGATVRKVLIGWPRPEVVALP